MGQNRSMQKGNQQKKGTGKNKQKEKQVIYRLMAKGHGDNSDYLLNDGKGNDGLIALRKEKAKYEARGLTTYLVNENGVPLAQQ